MPDPREEQKTEKPRTENESSVHEHDESGDTEALPELPEREHAPTRDRGGRYGDGYW